MHCDTSNHVPFVVPGLSTSSSTSHQLLLHLHRRKLWQTLKFQQQVEVKRRARTHQHEETRGTNRQKSKIPNKNDNKELQSGELLGVPDWLQDIEMLPVLLMDYLWSREQKWYQVNTTSLLISREDRNCDICLRTKRTRASCRRRTGTVVPRAEKLMI